MKQIEIQNVVASTALSSQLDLRVIADQLDGAEYAPDEFPGLIYRLKKPKTAILLFHSGKVVCTGGKSQKDVEESIRTISRMVRKTGQKVTSRPVIEIQNIVSTADLESDLDLNAIAVTLGLDRVEYEPEQFPGLVYRLEKPRVVILLFGSGKLVLTGARKPSDAQEAAELVKSDLERAGLLVGRRAAANQAPERQPSRPLRSTPQISA
jgi:transcription initiation factor TFIID TATA-box-binding protein